jgi:predicted flap endonuclease-1-like 5' DNA nuclease
MTSNVERYKRYLIESEKTWATKVHELQSKTEIKDHNDTALQAKINQLNTELNNAKASSTEAKKQLQAKINQLNTEQDNTKTSLLNDKEQLQTNVIHLHKKLTKAKSATTEEKNRLQTTINRLDNEQKATHIAQQAVTSCKQKLTAIENDNTQLNKTLKILTEKNRHTEKLLSATQQDYVKISQKYKTLSLELEQLHKQKPKTAAINKARADDLQKIKGIGKYNERILNKLGITHYAQIAHFTSQDEEKFGQELGVFATRISQEAWVGQAKILHQDKYGETISILHKDQK